MCAAWVTLSKLFHLKFFRAPISNLVSRVVIRAEEIIVPKYPLTVATILLCSSTLTFAGEPAVPVIVTATRTAQTADETLAAVTVITREDMERRQAQSFQDLLRGEPGFSIANHGGHGKLTSVFLRGTNSNHVLVLIDGVKVGSATAGMTAFEHIPLDQIERIEIVRGPRSSLYGANAIGGVIQIFTRKGTGPMKPYVSLGGGSDETYRAAVGISGGEHGWFSLNASGITTEGFNACSGKPFPPGGGCYTFEPDKDGYRSIAGSLRAGYRFDNGTELEMHALRADGKTEYDGSYANEAESVQQVLGGRLRFSPIAPWHITLTIGRSWDESDNFLNGIFTSRFDTERDTLSIQNDFSIGETQLLTVGFDYLEDRVDSTTNYAVTSRDNKGFFAQYQASLGQHAMELSLRRDDNEQFGHHTTGGAGWGYDFDNGLRLTASYGTAFNAPTFNQLYWPFFSNPNLQPEESRSLEFGLSKTLGIGRWSVNAFETHIDDLIGLNQFWQPVNINEARIRGLEAVIHARLQDWELRTNLTLLDPENRSPGTNRGNLLPRRAKQTLRLDVDRTFGSYRFGATLHAEGRRYDDLANTRALEGYATMDLRGEYLFTQAWRVQARIENLFDKDYETAEFYNQPGLGFFVTLHYQP